MTTEFILLKAFNLFSRNIVLFAFLSTILIKISIPHLRLKRHLPYKVLSVGLVYALLVVLVWLYPIRYEDLFFLARLKKENFNIFEQLSFDYLHSISRVPVLFYNYVFLYIKYMFELIGPLIYLLFIYVAYKIIHSIYIPQSYSSNSKKGRCTMFFFIFFVFYMSNPNFDQTVLWTTGTTTYLFPSVVAYIFMLLYIREFRRQITDMQGLSDKVFYIVLFFFLGLFAGWQIANISIGLFFFIVYILFGQYFIGKYMKKIEIKKWQISGAIGTFLGVLILMFSPAQLQRLQNRTELAHIEVNFFVNKFNWFIEISKIFTQRLGDVSKAVFHVDFDEIQMFIVILAILIAYYAHKKKYTKRIIDVYRRDIRIIFSNFNLVIFVGIILSSLVSFYVMILTPNYFPARAQMFPTSLLCIGVISTLLYLFDSVYIRIKDKDMKKIINTMRVFVFSLALFFFLDTYKNDFLHAWFYRDANVSLVNYIEKEKAKGNLNIVLTSENNPKLFYLNRYYGSNERGRFRRGGSGILSKTIVEGGNDWLRESYISYYGLEDFTVDSQDVKDLVFIGHSLKE